MTIWQSIINAHKRRLSSRTNAEALVGKLTPKEKTMPQQKPNIIITITQEVE